MIWAATGFIKAAVTEMNAMLESTAEVCALNITSFGNLPLSVPGRGLYFPIPSLSETENQQLWEETRAMQSELCGLSSNSAHTIAEESGLHIQFDQPDLVIEAILEMVAALQ